jgi:hypothetical protein
MHRVAAVQRGLSSFRMAGNPRRIDSIASS